MIEKIIKAVEDNIPAADQLLSWAAETCPLMIPSGAIGVGGHYQDLIIKLRIGYDPEGTMPPISEEK